MTLPLLLSLPTLRWAASQSGAASDKSCCGLFLPWETPKLSPLDGRQSRALIQIFKQTSRVAFPKAPGMREPWPMFKSKGTSHPNFHATSAQIPEGHGLPIPRVSAGRLSLSAFAKVFKALYSTGKVGGILSSRLGKIHQVEAFSPLVPC